MKKKILFVCKYNRFRSKIAEAFFKKFNRNNKYKAKSAGLIKGSPVDEGDKKLCSEFGIKINNPVQGLSTDLLKWQDMIVIVADNVPVSLFSQEKYGKKSIVWKIKDVHTRSREDGIKVIRLIEEKVKIFVGRLK